MTEDKEYKDLLSRRLEGAYDAVYPADEVPSAEDILRWQNMAEAKAGERKVRIRRLSTLAAVFLVSLALGVAIMVEPPKAEAGGDGKLEILGIGEQEERFGVETFSSFDELPEHIREEYLIFDDLPEECEISYIKITYSGKTEAVDTFIQKGETSLTINQWKVAEYDTRRTFIREGRKEMWGDIEVSINEYEYGEEQLSYLFEYEKITVGVVTAKDFPKDELREMIMSIIEQQNYRAK